jgi:sterol desaturase/sphingolipid hydroxylase (fatty acid hydroxylase superfamily)
METIAGPLIPFSFVALLVVERVFPARRLPRVRWWLLKGFIGFAIAGALSAVIPAAITSALALHTLAGVPAWAQVVVALLATELLSYVVHRAMHTIPALWRWTHQMHHSAERIDIAGSAIFHPFELALRFTLAGLVIAALGVEAGPAALTGYLNFFLGTFQHLNVRTPQWLGWILQRPEAHSIHHARGVHAYNYGNLMVFDILFGTFRNPAAFTEEAGFWDGASTQIGRMLAGRDVATKEAL